MPGDHGWDRVDQGLWWWTHQHIWTKILEVEKIDENKEKHIGKTTPIIVHNYIGFSSSFNNFSVYFKYR